MELLVTEGVAAIKISRLCQHLGVTKGSFYWHFADIGSLMTALAEHCRRAQESAMQTLSELADLPPVDRIDAMSRLVTDDRRWKVEAAVRAWAATDETIAESVAALDQRVFDVAYQAMIDLGFSETEAHARATTALYAGIGFLHGRRQHGVLADADIRIFVEMLTRR
ncbi:putative TetR family transcriptional regulator [Gordonia soli NBRC 108243]|uniref:Putative TetR family transcriptional regulator n=2 Tax=Gordonia soli TaxID=320799 RepID=M0QK37_9ACTN|nr:putative TetR family transcriptional regulator [Gordonia soli NBRC 108243]